MAWKLKGPLRTFGSPPKCALRPPGSISRMQVQASPATAIKNHSKNASRHRTVPRPRRVKKLVRGRIPVPAREFPCCLNKFPVTPKKLPVPLRREFDCKPLKLLVEWRPNFFSHQPMLAAGSTCHAIAVVIEPSTNPLCIGILHFEQLVIGLSPLDASCVRSKSTT